MEECCVLVMWHFRKPCWWPLRVTASRPSVTSVIRLIRNSGNWTFWEPVLEKVWESHIWIYPRISVLWRFENPISRTIRGSRKIHFKRKIRFLGNLFPGQSVSWEMHFLENMFPRKVESSFPRKSVPRNYVSRKNPITVQSIFRGIYGRIGFTKTSEVTVLDDPAENERIIRISHDTPLSGQ